MVNRVTESLHATPKTAHEFGKVVLADVYNFAYSTSECIPFGDCSYFTFWHCERIEGSLTSSGHELVLKDSESI